MNVPLLGPLTLSGFANSWFFLYLFVVLAVLGGYIAVLLARRKRVMRFANMELLEKVAPKRARTRWRHVPAALLVAALALLTTAMAGPTHDIRIPRNRAVVMLVIDVSESMAATDVAPSRIEAARQAGKQFAHLLTPGINLGLVAFAANAVLLVAPTTDREAVDRAIDTLQPQPRTATGEGIYTALQAIATVGAVMGGGDGPPPARIVLESDGKETVPADPNQPRGAFPAARAAKDQGVQISTISFGTPDGVITFQGMEVPVPVDDATLQQITEITGGQAFHAGSLDELSSVYATLQQQIGYQTISGDASESWIRLGVIALAAALFAGVLINRRLPA
jgi:Ca-activated chloride channel family protein